MTPDGKVLSVSLSPSHGFSKMPVSSIRLLAGKGVEGDAHCGETVQHLYLKRRNPLAPNRTQVHLLQAELFDEVALAGFAVQPGQMGENITTQGLDLIHLPLRTHLQFEGGAVVELTGLRTPCKKIDDFQSGLLRQMTGRDEQQRAIAKAGVMGIVLCDGVVEPGATILTVTPEGPCKSLPMI